MPVEKGSALLYTLISKGNYQGPRSNFEIGGGGGGGHH